MRSKIFIQGNLLLLFFYVHTASAQIGIKAGPGISDVAFLKAGQSPYLGYEVDYLEHRKPFPTFQAGIFSTFGLWKNFDIQPELLFILQGLDYSKEFIYDDITYKLKIGYLHAPLLLKCSFFPKKKWHPALLGGPYASLKLKAVRVTEIDGKKNKTPMPNVKNADFGLVAGFSADFYLFSGQMVVDLRGSYSLVNMMDRIDGYVPSYYGSKKEYARNVSISLTVGYQYNIWWRKTERS